MFRAWNSWAGAWARCWERLPWTQSQLERTALAPAALSAPREHKTTIFLPFSPRADPFIQENQPCQLCTSTCAMLSLLSAACLSSGGEDDTSGGLQPLFLPSNEFKLLLNISPCFVSINTGRLLSETAFISCISRAVFVHQYLSGIVFPTAQASSLEQIFFIRPRSSGRCRISQGSKQRRVCGGALAPRSCQSCGSHSSLQRAG